MVNLRTVSFIWLFDGLILELQRRFLRCTSAECTHKTICNFNHLIRVVGQLVSNGLSRTSHFGISVKIYPFPCDLLSNIDSCVSCIGWLFICFTCERRDMSKIVRRCSRVVATFKKVSSGFSIVPTWQNPSIKNRESC